MWYDEAVVYQIYPLGLCGAPLQNDGDQAQAGEHRILRVLDWVEHIKRLGATCVLFNPLFESDAHGYDTRDYNKVDCRLSFASPVPPGHKRRPQADLRSAARGGHKNPV